MDTKAKGSVENGSEHKEEVPISTAMSKTTTISTIAVQSGKTRIVIALLHCGDWINLKILEITPELTTLGETLQEALELQRAHNEVLRQLQNKQSPVEELLRQADQLIATQKPRAEVYAAMAESLGRAWKDINSNLELRKQILDLNVQYHTKAQEFFDKMDALEASCKDTVVPIEIEAVKNFLAAIHDLRRALLESLMGALQAGNSLLGKLKELGAEGTLDSRPERIRSSVNRAISQVQGWLDQLHLRRQILEATFNRRKTQLEQCLALAVLAADLRELEDKVHERREFLANSNQYGDSSSSAELLLHEHKKLLPEAKQLQERALKITRATEQLVASGCFAGEQASAQAYTVLSATSDYLTDLQNRESLLNRVISFFRTAQTVLAKLDQLEIQLTATELPKTSPQLAQLHAHCSRAIEDATAAPITEGYAILDLTGRGVSGTDGIRRMVEELENKKISLDGLCTAHREENIRINTALNNFLEKHNEIYTWLVTIAEAFLQGHQQMGGDLPMAKDFLDLHNQLLSDLQTKGNEINALLLTLPPILEYLEDNQRRDVDTKVEELHDRWMKLKNILENRLDLSRIYVKFHMEADIVNDEMNKLEASLLQNKDNIDDETMRRIEEKFESIVPLYQSAKNTGLTFISDAQRVSEPHLDTKRACLCVESVLERLSGRQLVVSRNWQTFHTEVVEKRELLVRLEQTMAESTKTISWVSKLENQLYPVITTGSTKPSELADHLENKLETVVPDIKKAQSEVEERIKNAEALTSKAPPGDEQARNVKNKLYELNQKLIEISSEYQILLQVLIGYFRNLEEIDKKAENLNAELEKTGYPKDIAAVESIVREHELSRQTITERLRFAQTECDQIAQRIRKQEPEAAADQDINKLQHVLELRRGEFENQWRQRHDSLESHKQVCQFDSDLQQINESIDDLSRQLKDRNGQYGESLSSAKATSQTFGYFERSMETLEIRIKKIVDIGEKLLTEPHAQSPPIQSQISDLQDRWNSLKKQEENTRSLIDLSIPYFQLVEEADEWFREGSKLLVTIARKSTAVKTPEEAESLLNEISAFLEPGEQKQNERIAKISELAIQLYGPDETKRAPVVQGNKEMLESFSLIRQELTALAGNLRTAEEERQRLQREQEEARKAEEARVAEEARLAEEKRKAEEARIAEERQKAEEARLDEERRKAEEARLAEEKRKAEDARLEEERQKAQEAKLAEEKRRAEEARLAEEKRKAEEDRIAEEKRKAEEARIAEEKKKAEEARIAKEKRKAEEARLAEEKRKIDETEKARIAEEKRKLEETKLAEEEKRRAEKARIEEELRVSEEKRKAAKAAPQNLEKQGLLEITEITEVHKVESQGVRKQIPSPIPIIEEASEIPVFTTPLSDAVIQEGSKFTFICQVAGHPKPLVTWYKAGISIQNNPDYHTAYENGLCSLTIEETFAEDSARYTCRAANAAGEAETTALLSVKETEPEEQVIAPSFSKLLQPGVAKEGTPFQFVCKVEGNPLPTVQWYKNSDCIDNSPDYIITYNNGEAILKFENVFLEDKAEYTCKAANELGTAQSTANLVVTPLEPTEAPAFVVPLSNVMARAGQKIKLECEVSGLPLPTLTWSHNGKPVKETRELKLQCEDKKATLIIYEAFPKDAGTYQVSAKNIAGEANSSCSVSVKGRLPTETSDSEMASDMEPVKPSIQLPLADTAVKEGNRIRLDCVIVGQPEPEVIWYHDDRPVKESPDFQLLFQGDRCSLVIQEALPEDAGEYKVVALNSAGEASSKCILSVTLAAESDAESKPPEEKKEPVSTAPKFTKLLTDSLMSEGEKVILEGNVVGEPRPEVKWLLNNLPITDKEHFNISHDDEGNVRLEIVSVRPEDKGVYTVKATNSAGEAKCFAQLIVKGGKPLETIIHEEVKLAPEFKEVFHDRTAFEDTPTKFECIATGKPKPKIKWLFNGNAISGMDFLISTSGDRQVLAISVLKKEHNGTITCVAENEVGKASCAATLSVQPPSSISLPEIPLQPPLQVPQQVSVFSSLTPMHTEKSQHIETSYKNTREVVTQSSTSKSSKITSSTSGITEPHVEEHKVIAEDSQTFKQINQEAPVIKESHRLEEYHKVGKEPPVFQEKSSASYSIGQTSDISQSKLTEHREIIQKPLIKTRPPRFVTPVTGRIIDQNVDVLLEGILDGQPSPNISWTKNGEELKATERVKIKWEQNRASVEIKNANIEDAGRYSCTAVNEGGTAVSTADLVVRKTIFPPVFGRRLQAQVVKKGERIIMEVEVTGTPEPTVTWYRDGVPVQESLKDNYKIKSMGQSHTLVIDKADLAQSGRFMVRAVNAGGEAQSIADIAVYEPTPDTMLEVVKTVVFEDVRKHETLELIDTPIITNSTSKEVYESQEKHVQLEPFPFKAEPPKSAILKGPPPPTPSKFTKGGFHESDYESDYEGRIPPIWGSDTDRTYKPVRPVLTPSQQHQQYGRTPTPPTEFDNPPQIGTPRPKFEPIEKFKPQVRPAPKPVYKPKPISAAPVTDVIVATPAVQTVHLKPGSPPEMRYSPGPKRTQYYKSTVSAPYHNAVQTETSNVMHFNESSESCHRTMSLQQTHKVIKFGDQYKREESNLEPFPFQPEPGHPRRATSVPPPPTPSKFLPGEFRESDYESEVENVRIKPKWLPSGTQDDSLRYRRVRAPAASRSSSVPAPRDRVVTPMEFDTQPPPMPSQISTTDITDGSQTRKHESMYKNFSQSKTGQVVKRSHSYEPAIHPGTPPEYGYIGNQKLTKSTATKIASQHMDSMTQAFKSKTQKFVKDIMGDVNKQQQKPILKSAADGDAQVYREESRAAQYGTKHVDPDTGLIYFKYDFGYEFGIVLPGESKQGEIPVPKKTVIEPPKRTVDIEMPVYHEKTQDTNHVQTPRFKPQKFTPSGGKPAKWEPTSESEMSEYEGEAKRRNNLMPGSGRKGAETPPSCPSTPGSTHGKIILQPGQARAPMFITPLRDIAVVSGQAAKFECIVQSEPPPNVLWSKNGRIIEYSNDYQLHYRNGVCRLTISQAYPEDAGTYTCTATNPVGTANTTATLQVPGERRSQYI